MSARIDRRGMLKGTALLGAAAATPMAVQAEAAPRATLLVYDSRLPESAAFAAGHPARHRLDLAREHARQWSGLRGQLPMVGAVEGLTGWSDWVAVRGELQARGLRCASEAPVRAPLSGKAHLFRWAMRAR